MRIALAGKPGCGRSTLLRAMAGKADLDTSKPLTIAVPDERLDFLFDHHSPEKETRSTVVFTDTPSPSFAPRNLPQMRNAAVIALVLDNYALGAIEEDFLEMDSDLILEDLALLDKRLARLKKESRGGSREAVLLERLLQQAGEGHPLRTMDLTSQETELLLPYALLSLKPLIVISNRMGEPVTPEEGLEERVRSHGGFPIRVDAGFELELSEIPEDERQEFLESMGYVSSGLSKLIRTAQEALDLIVFFTIGKDEVRAWPLPKGSTALDAAAAIHSDLARGFIRAVVIHYDVFRENPDRNLLREKGMLGIEGKDYVVKDGDIIEIRFNV